MEKPNNRRIVVLEEYQAHQEVLRTIVENTGHLAFIFDTEATFFNNFIPIDADLTVFRSASIDKVSRILNTLLFFNYYKPVVVISENPKVRHFIDSIPDIRVGVVDYPYQRMEIMTTINMLLDGYEQDEYGDTFPVIVGNTPEMVRIRNVISELKHNNDAVLIQGEGGTGKELLAKSIHVVSTKNNHCFVKTNISRNLFESGNIETGLFPEATSRIIPNGGDFFFEGREGGTLYFEAIDTIPTTYQGMLLQYFDSNQAENIRIIASSRSKIDHLVQKGGFRKDLYFRLNVIEIEVPPLRERKTDIPLLADFFINKFCLKSGIGHFQLSNRVKNALAKYHWPNNVEELKSFVSQDNSLGSEKQILNRINALAEKNRPQAFNSTGNYTAPRDMRGEGDRISLKKITKQFTSRIETEILKLALEKTNWNRKQAAETLSISYKSLLNKIKAYNLN